jgi:hypothetical protein
VTANLWQGALETIVVVSGLLLESIKLVLSNSVVVPDIKEVAENFSCGLSTIESAIDLIPVVGSFSDVDLFDFLLLVAIDVGNLGGGVINLIVGVVVGVKSGPVVVLLAPVALKVGVIGLGESDGSQRSVDE